MFVRVPGPHLTSDQRRELRLASRFFPNQVAEGCFAPHSTIVEVAAFRPDEVASALNTRNLLPVRRDIQVLCHEMAHWFDFFGTMWGRGYAAAICRAHLAMGQGEAGFPELVELFDLDRRILAPAYYRFTTPPSVPHDAGHPWSIDYTSGCEIGPDGRTNEQKPIYLVRFGENPSRRTFARQPLSVGSLLEVRAVAAEIKAGLTAIASCPDEGVVRTEAHIMSREFNRLAYNHALIEYNVAAHLLSARAGTIEPVLTYQLAGALAFIALNLQRSDFDRLRVPASFKPFGKRNAAFKRNMDRGYAFACLINNGGRYEEGQDYVEACVQASGLGSTKEVLSRAAKALTKPLIVPRVTAFTAHFVRESLMSGLICDAFERQPNFTLTLDMLSECQHVCPPFMHAEGGFLASSPGRAEEYDPEGLYGMSLELRASTRNLLVGCRGFDEGGAAL